MRVEFEVALGAATDLLPSVTCSKRLVRDESPAFRHGYVNGRPVSVESLPVSARQLSSLSG